MTTPLPTSGWVTTAAGPVRAEGHRVLPRPRLAGAANVIRAGFVVLVIVAAPLVEGVAPGDRLALGLVLAFGFVPLAGLADAVVRRRPRLGPAATVVDHLAFLPIMVVLTPVAAPLAFLQLLGVAYHSYVGAGPGQVASLASAVTVVGLAELLTPDAPVVGWFPGLLLAGGAVATVALARALRTEQRVAADDLARQIDKAQSILTGIADAVFVTTPRGRVTEWNRAAERTFDCPSGAAVGAQCRDVLNLRHDLAELDCRQGCAVLAAQREATGADVELWRRANTGERQPLLVRASPILDRDGRVVEVVHSVRDISRIRQADEAKTMFLATASHELKTPLAVIKGFAELLLEGDPPAAGRRSALEAIDRRTDELSKIVDRLLMSSRIEAGRIKLDRQPVDLVPILEERITSLATSTGRDVRLEAPVQLPAVLADGDAFTTVIDHLLDNAVKYSPDGGPITVTVAVHDGDVTVACADRGIGMTVEQQEQCFDRFWQAEGGDVRRFRGAGIGLYIVRSLVEGMGGTVAVSSVPGDGTTFTLALTRADVAGADGAGADGAAGGRDGAADGAAGEPSIVREFMRQVGLQGGA